MDDERSGAPPPAAPDVPDAPPGTALTPRPSLQRLLRGFLPGRRDGSPLGSLEHDVAIAFAGNLLAKALGFLTFVLMTRVLNPRLLARLALADMVFQIALQLSDLGLETGVTRFVSKGLRGRDVDATERVLKAVFVAKLAAGVVVFAGAFAIAPFIASDLLESSYASEMTGYIRISLVGIFGAHLVGFYQAYFAARLDFARNALFNLLSPALVFLAIFTANRIRGLDVATCLVIYAVTPAVVCLAAFAMLPHGFLQKPTSLAALRPVWRFSRWIYATNTLGELRFRTSNVLLSRMSTDYQLGLYYYGDKLAAMLTLFTSTILTVFLPRAAHLVTQSELNELLRRSYRWMLLLLPPLLVVPLVAEPLIYRLAPKFAEAAPFFAILFVSILFSLAALPARTVIYSINKPHIETWVEIGALLFTVGAGFFLVRSQGALGAALTMLCQRALSCAVLVGWVHLRVSRAARHAVETSELTGMRGE